MKKCVDFLIVLCSVLLLLSGCGNKKTEDSMTDNFNVEPDTETANENMSDMFIGENRVLLSFIPDRFSERQQDIVDLMNKYKLNTLYQALDLDDIDSIKKFQESYNVNLYVTNGTGHWSRSIVKDYINKISSVNEVLDRDIKGFVFYTNTFNPELNETLEESTQSWIDFYIDVLKEAKAAAEGTGLEIVACISGKIDDYGYSDRLDTIMENCDRVIVKCEKGNELDAIKTEYLIAEKYNKDIIEMFDVQGVPEDEILKERLLYTIYDSYHDEGIEEMLSVYSNLLNEYENLGFAISCFDCLYYLDTKTEIKSIFKH